MTAPYRTDRHPYPATCGRHCGDCVVYQGLDLRDLSDRDGRRRRLPAAYRSCASLRRESRYCWGALCAMRSCCRYCGLGYAFQCRRHPCRPCCDRDAESPSERGSREPPL